MLTDKTGKTNEKMVLNEEISIQGLNQLLTEKYQTLKNCSYKIALNNQFVDPQNTITSNATISLLPPFSGG